MNIKNKCPKRQIYLLITISTFCSLYFIFFQIRFNLNRLLGLEMTSDYDNVVFLCLQVQLKKFAYTDSCVTEKFHRKSAFKQSKDKVILYQLFIIRKINMIFFICKKLIEKYTDC